MPRLTVYFIRAALIYLLLGFTLGGLLLWQKGMSLHPAIWQLLPAHMEFLLLGWTVQLVFGTAYWILPRFHNQRRRQALAWLSFVLLNGGIGLVVIGSWPGSPQPMQLMGRLLEFASIVLFAAHAWPRIKPISDFL
ncbi:MAG: hypothetical protein KF832_16545 [Caldilineaceae bacterium]|nr:hypothetical protein [Caldilineaceae bacterium]